jgi:hypothetical protein
MIGYCSPGGVVFKLCLYFARNPDEELWSEDLINKFGATYDLNNLLRSAKRNGLIKVEKRPGQRQHVYTAGPTLREMIGVAA